jgi:DNA-binding transcriptional regulator YiaG
VRVVDNTFDRRLEEARAVRRLPPRVVCRQLREQAGLSQDDIARVLGTTRVAVALWELGRRTPRPAMAVRYLAVLNRLATEATAP